MWSWCSRRWDIIFVVLPPLAATLFKHVFQVGCPSSSKPWPSECFLVPEKFPYRRLCLFRRGKKFQWFTSFGHHPTHRWLSLTARTNRRGRGRVTCYALLHTTEGVLHFLSLTTRKKTEHTAVYLSKPRYTLKPVIVPCLGASADRDSPGCEFSQPH